MQNVNDYMARCQEAKTRIKEVSDDDVDVMLTKGEIDLLIDVRPMEQFQQQHLPDARNIPGAQVEAQVPRLIQDKQAKIVIYCMGGNSSALAADTLQSLGYSNVCSMIGGLQAWCAAGKTTS